MAKENVDVSLLRQLIRYEPETGRLFWLPRPREMFGSDRSWKIWNTRFSGKEALAVGKGNGYCYGAILSRNYLAHRVAWALATGAWPEEQIDHINGDRSDNRLENIRAVSNAENGKNTSIRVDNTSGVVGVSWSDRRSKWVAYINADSRRLPLGRFDSFEDAVAARKAAEVRYSFHPNHGRAA